MGVERITSPRPPCSPAEREAAEVVASGFEDAGLHPAMEKLRAPTSPTWLPLTRALLRLWAAAFLAAGWPVTAAALGGVAVLGGLPFVGGLIRFVPLFGATTQNVFAKRHGANEDARPIVVIAHLDAHPAARSPMSRTHTLLSALSGVLVLAFALAAPWGVSRRTVAGFVAAEAIATIVWLARRELRAPPVPADDDASGLLALVRLAERLEGLPVPRDIWLVASGAGTSGSCGVTTFLRRRPQVRSGWVIEIDELGSGEVVAAPFAARFPRPGTPAKLVRAVTSAARETGDPLNVRHLHRPHSDARAALRLRVPAIAITAGLRSPAEGSGPDPGNAERAARLVERVARIAS